MLGGLRLGNVTFTVSVLCLASLGLFTKGRSLRLNHLKCRTIRTNLRYMNVKGEERGYFSRYPYE